MKRHKIVLYENVSEERLERYVYGTVTSLMIAGSFNLPLSQTSFPNLKVLKISPDSQYDHVIDLNRWNSLSRIDVPSRVLTEGGFKKIDLEVYHKYRHHLSSVNITVDGVSLNAMITNVNVDKLECSICLEDVVYNRVWSCFYCRVKVCYGCLDDIIDYKTAIRCPSCRHD